MSEEKTSEYFYDRITEELLKAHLADKAGIRMIQPTDVSYNDLVLNCGC